jgi:DNA excision repair protein ERCC-1
MELPSADALARRRRRGEEQSALPQAFLDVLSSPPPQRQDNGGSVSAAELQQQQQLPQPIQRHEQPIHVATGTLTGPPQAGLSRGPPSTAPKQAARGQNLGRGAPWRGRGSRGSGGGRGGRSFGPRSSASSFSSSSSGPIEPIFWHPNQLKNPLRQHIKLASTAQLDVSQDPANPPRAVVLGPLAPGSAQAAPGSGPGRGRGFVRGLGRGAPRGGGGIGGHNAGPQGGGPPQISMEQALAHPDYVLGEDCCAVFMMLSWYRLQPGSLASRLQAVREGGAFRKYRLRILLCQLDIDDNAMALKEVALEALKFEVTLVVAWNARESARWLETFKNYERKGPELIQARQKDDFVGQVEDVLTVARGVNTTDVKMLLDSFDTVEGVFGARMDELAVVRGLAATKVQRLFSCFHAPFAVAENKPRQTHLTDSRVQQQQQQQQQQHQEQPNSAT